MKFSHRVEQIKPSATIAISDRAKALQAQGQDIISLSMGEPDFDTPTHIKAAAITAINEGQTKYTPVDGIPALKDAIIAKFERDNQLHYERHQVIASTGAKQCIFNLCQALLNEGDEVIIPAPYWVSYPDIVLLSGAQPVILPTADSQNFKITPQQLEQAITSKTRLMMINSPSNPSGKAYTQTELAALGEVLLKHPQVMIATDDIYEQILWAHPFANILMSTPALYDRTVVINGLSKSYAMTGWRLGYAAGPESLIKMMKKIQSQSTSNPNSITQAAAVAALTGQQDCVREMVEAFKNRHDQVMARLNAIDGIHVQPADGAFYAFINVADIIKRLNCADDTALAQYLLDKAKVALVPGSAFGTAAHLRLSFAADMDTLNKALDRIEKAVSKNTVTPE